jgi:hypothetical protein
MKPVVFKHANRVYGENQSEYQPLPALSLEDEQGHVVSCWKLSFLERIKLLFTGRIWMSLMTFNKPIQPSYLSVNRKEMYSAPEDK